MKNRNSGIELRVIDWSDGSRQVAIYVKDFDQMITFSSESARTLAFMLMECADFIQSPFQDSKGDEATHQNTESESWFGPYDREDDQENDEDQEDDDEIDMST